MLSPDLLLHSLSDTLFGLICHQDPAILIELNGRTLMLCPRCTGLHVGFLLAWFSIWLSANGKLRVEGAFTKWFSLLSISFLFAEWFLAQVQVVSSSAESRYVSGLFAGAACLLLVVAYRNRMITSSKTSAKPNSVNLIVRTAAALLVGLLLSRLDSWFVVTAGLLLAVVCNFMFFLFTLLLRVKFILSNYKIRIP